MTDPTSDAGGGIDFKQATFPNGTAIAVPTSSFVEWDGGSYVGRKPLDQRWLP
jgi:hypothetical protein